MQALALFGIYPLGHDLTDVLRFRGENYLKNDCLIDPDMTADDWKVLTKFSRAHTSISPGDYEREAGRLFGGILPLGSQGCSYSHGIVLNGPHKGRVVNLDFDGCMPPIFACGANFLDWYEKWLDEIIDGTQLQPDAPMFGY